MSDPLARFQTPTAAQLRQYLHAGMLVAAFRVGLWTIPYRHLRTFATGPPARRRAASVDLELQSIRKHVISVSRCIPRATCLPRALAATVLIRQRGIAAELRLGVARIHGQFQAHAWVESHGRIVVGDGPELSEFRVLT